MGRNWYSLVAAAVAVGLIGSACSGSNSGTEATSSRYGRTAVATTISQPATATTANEELPSLIPTPANAQQTRGPDPIADNGIHMYFQVDGAPSDVMNAYKTALEAKAGR